MPRSSPAILSFNAGIFSPHLDGRVDLSKYNSACRVMNNFFPLIAGPAKKRPGTRFVNEVKTSSLFTRLVSFEFGTTQAYILEFGNLYMRVYKDGGIVLDGAGPAVFELVTPYATADLEALYFAQSADVLYVAHPEHAPAKITRTDHDAWTITTIGFDFVPFQPENIGATTVVASGTTGTITLTASAALFTADMVGAHVKLSEIVPSNHGKWESASANTSYSGTFAAGETRYWEDNVYTLGAGSGNTGTSPPIHDVGTKSDGKRNWTYLHSGAGYALITGFTSSTVVDATVVKTIPTSATSATTRWALGAWSDENGFPRCVAFYEDRLVWAGSNANPQTLWLSRTGDYEDHRQSDEDESALVFTLNTDQVNVIEWISPGEELAIGTAGGEFTLSGGGEPLTAGTVTAPRRGTRGSKATVPPIRVGEQVLFVQRSGRKLLELVFDDATDGFISIDTTILADLVTEPGIRKMAYQKEPHRINWCVLDNGELVALSYEREQQVTGWHRHPLGGTDVFVESVAVIPHPDQDQDQVWLAVRRTVDGGTVRYIEYIEKDWLSSFAQEDAFFVDSGLTYDGAAATTISGLDHLEGQTVSVLTDGAVHPPVQVVSGEITLQWEAEVVQVGLTFQANLQTMRIEAGSGEGVAQGKTKRIQRVVFRLYQCGGAFKHGLDPADTLDQIEFRNTDDPLDAAIPLFNGDTARLQVPPRYDQVGCVAFRHDLPLPCTLIAIYPQLATQDGG